MRRLLVLMTMGYMLAGMDLFAQDAANIVGTVTDDSGSSVAGAKITVSNPEKAIVRHAESSGGGEFRITDLAIGKYVVSVEMAGFRRLERREITMQVGETLRLDLQLKLGEINQTVVVSGDVPHVATENASVSDVVTGAQVSNLELNGRDFLGLALLVPGASPGDSMDLSVAAHGTSSIQISFNGGRARYNNVEIDGNSNWDEGGFNQMDTYPSIDSIAEFRVTTSNYGADSGKLGSASIEVVTKSGTKDFHGTAYEFVRNNVFDANDWFLNRAGQPRAPLKRNDFGYTIGGPVYIPKHYNTSKAKTFFFWSQEWHRYVQSKVINSTVPTLLMRKGDFSECDSASPNFNPVVASGCSRPQLTIGGVTTTYDNVQSVPGFNAQAFTNATDLLNAMVPLPNTGVESYVTAASENTQWRQDQIRVDQNINSKTSLFVRYTHDTTNVLLATGARDSSTYDTIKTPDYRTGANVVLHVIRIFKPNLTNDFQLGFHTNYHTYNAVVGPSSQAGSIDEPPGFVLNHIYAVNSSNPLLPALAIGGKGVPFSFKMDASQVPYENASPTYELKDGATWVLGKQTLKFGVYLSEYQKNQNLQTGVDTQGFLSFNSSSAISSGNPLGDMFLGRIASYTESSVTSNGVPVGGYGRGYWRGRDFEPYIQDDWKVTHKLTLNIGLRYYYYIPQHDIHNPPVDVNFLPSLYNPSEQAQIGADGNLIPGSGFNYTMLGNGLVQCGRNGIPEGCFSPSERNFGPRFGFAYDPWGDGKTAIRGGYGIYYDFTSEGGAEGIGGNPPSALSASGANIVGYTNIVAGSLPPNGLFVAIPLSQKFPSVQQFNLSVQHEFRGNNFLSVGYVGSLGRHNDRLTDLNQIPIGVGTVNVPALAGLTGTVGPVKNSQGSVIAPGDLGQTLCDTSGNCNVQTILNYNEASPNFFVPYRGFSATPNGGLSLNPLNATSSYHSLQVNFRHTFNAGLTVQAAYTWSHEIDDATSDSNPSGVDDTNPQRWKATGDLNRTHVLILNYIYDLPFFRKSSNAFLRGGLGGWTVSGVTSFYTGVPIDFGIAGPNGPACGIPGFSTGIGLGVQCDLVGPLKAKKSTQIDPQFGPMVTWFDPSVVAQPTFAQLAANGQSGMFGNMGRNVLTGPGRNNWDLALLKNISLPWFRGEHSTLQFRFETFNTFNHPQWSGINVGCNGSNPDGTPAFGSPCTGLVNGLLNGEVTSAFAPRNLQFGLKFVF
jgi:Carboxypeptidase regulatory-like domain